MASDRVRVVGVHAIDADELVHLVEIDIGDCQHFDFGKVTQRAPGRPRSDWQVAYDEQEVVGSAGRRLAFFFHYLDLDEPLITSAGEMALPPVTPLPSHLQPIRYDPP